jgi:hypothetical protein
MDEQDKILIEHPERCPKCGSEQIGPAEVVPGTAVVVEWGCWACLYTWTTEAAR